MFRNRLTQLAIGALSVTPAVLFTSAIRFFGGPQNSQREDDEIRRLHPNAEITYTPVRVGIHGIMIERHVNLNPEQSATNRTENR